jgi:hypothetical protein
VIRLHEVEGIRSVQARIGISALCKHWGSAGEKRRGRSAAARNSCQRSEENYRKPSHVRVSLLIPSTYRRQVHRGEAGTTASVTEPRKRQQQNL